MRSCLPPEPLPDPDNCECGYPARVLAEVAAKRAILAAYEAAKSNVPPADDWYEVADGVCVGLADGLGLAVKHATAVYSGRPGYRPEWAPAATTGEPQRGE